jgi:hypothetical protein
MQHSVYFSSYVLRTLTDGIGLKVQGVSSISCECGTACVGQIGSFIEIRLQECDHHYTPISQTN